MPTIPVNLGDVKGWTDLPVGTYLAQIEKITYRPPREAGKSPQLMVTYKVIDDGPQLGATSSEFLSMSERAMPRLKKWFDKFGLGDVENFDVDDDTDELVDPDLAEVQVIIESYEDKPKPGETLKQIRTRLISVEDELDDVAPPPKAAKKAKVEVEAEEDDEDEDDEEDEEPAPAPRRAKPVAREAKAKRRSLR